MEVGGTFLVIALILIVAAPFFSSFDDGASSWATTGCFDSHHLYPFIVAATVLLLRIRDRGQFIAMFEAVPILALGVVFSLDAEKASAGLYLDWFILFLLGLVPILVRVCFPRRPADRQRRIHTALAAFLFAFVYCKFAAAALFSGSPAGVSGSYTNFYFGFFLIFLASTALLVLTVRQCDPPVQDGGVRGHVVQAVLVLLFAKLSTVAVAALIAPCLVDGRKVFVIMCIDAILFFLARTMLFLFRARARRVREAILLVFLIVKIGATVFFSQTTDDRGVKIDVARFNPDLLMLCTAAGVFLWLENM